MGCERGLGGEGVGRCGSVGGGEEDDGVLGGGAGDGFDARKV